MLPILYQARIDSPLGPLRLVHDDEKRIRALDFDDYEGRMLRLLRLHLGRAGHEFTLMETAPDAAIKAAFDAYFAGELNALDDLPTKTGGTPFQRNVWAALRTIPAGHTMSYGELAAKIGQTKAVRAVGLANGANPIAIIVPCHRVIGANYSLTGYGGGLERKRWLLAHEGVLLDTGPLARVARPPVGMPYAPPVR
ncbi:methylated-DNA--[protein]-cysteine S-methyltransferase [Acuticoccus sediminis]|uniref:Methylated-DNA--protein-cysteine methyltransferase n=1 Tax=Acuticoccus sediminis TaxID=2184697 RepID=A0A8B2NK02_9HYPH|nr:methylated-DNA--[protein]-cysteine S-methyltransferase [Acuticoccus sediminis]RAH98224.1 methylated-DNA--[protein]-cysteine S-methyltransferase [Acuticoccus sediminis]